MARQTTYSCPGTPAYGPHTFGYFHFPDVERDPCPRFCPKCGLDSEAADFPAMPSTPHIAKSIGKAGDMTYRQMEAQAEDRIEAAAEMTGMDASEFSDMKITNLNDNMRAGDTAAIAPPASDVSRALEAQPNQFGYQSNAPVQNYVPGQAPTTVAEKTAVNAMASTVNDFHVKNHRAMNAQAETARFNGA